MRKLTESPSLIELRLIAGLLENEGVAVRILNEHQGGGPGVPHWALSVWAELWVDNPYQFERAAKLMARYQHEQSQEVIGEWTCSGCSENSPTSFESCWNCGRSSSVVP